MYHILQRQKKRSQHFLERSKKTKQRKKAEIFTHREFDELTKKEAIQRCENTNVKIFGEIAYFSQ